ncbi:uncharacterized protein M421DRAFT_425565 [Didymella exigua CBS 183.55]|uniref:Uncharacterized protein n=1 Tax=Didymella exigua CBS 183.55 TaxID=1150837 RepID=A0A6A5R8M1_9PLEO|nr:uncharacterized protein M421DRAFT_425565 [Didymella exigua CBS 183.55]KAF1923669.1 hypothetical protein M421DRAFT_425565 [Didymella exigua CBS 183.55]
MLHRSGGGIRRGVRKARGLNQIPYQSGHQGAFSVSCQSKTENIPKILLITTNVGRCTLYPESEYAVVTKGA